MIIGVILKKNLKKIFIIVVSIYALLSSTAFLYLSYLMLNERKMLNPLIMHSLAKNDNSDLLQYGSFQVLYHYVPLKIPPSIKTQPYLVGNVNGSGIVQYIAFHAGYYGIAIGYSADNGRINWINNGDCLVSWGANSPLAIDAPVRLNSYKDIFNLDIGINAIIPFKKNLKIYFINSADKPYEIKSLHLYGYFSDLISDEKNNLVW